MYFTEPYLIYSRPISLGHKLSEISTVFHNVVHETNPE